MWHSNCQWDLRLSLLRRCADYGEKVFACVLFIASPTSSRVGDNLRERTMRLRVEMTGVSTQENAAGLQGRLRTSRPMAITDGSMQGREGRRLHTRRPHLQNRRRLLG